MIYLDACVVIYWVEEHSVYAPCIEQWVLKAAPAPLAISPLTMTEALVLPYRQNHIALIQKYEAFFANSLILPLTDAVFINAARLRANHSGLKTPDALHLATAQYHGCSSLWTNDNRLERTMQGYTVNVCERKL